MTPDKPHSIAGLGKPPSRRPVFLLAAFLFVSGCFATWLGARSAHEFMRGIMLAEARMLAASLDVERIIRLTGTSADLESPDYHEIRAQLIRMRNANPRYRYIYMFGRRGSQPPFFFMGTAPEDSPDYSPPGMVYFEDSPTLNHVLNHKEERVSPPFSDRWGTWISSLVPIVKPKDGSLVAVFGMDFEADEWRQEVWRRSLIPVVVTALAIFLVLIVAERMHRRHLSVENRILAEGAKEMGLFFDVVPDILLLADSQGHVSRLNEAFAEALGFSIEDMKGKDLLDLVHPDDQHVLSENLAQGRDSDSMLETSLRFRTKDGAYRQIEWRMQPYGGLLYAAGRDTTDRLRLESQLRQAQKMEAIGQLAGGVAHDFNNILQAILGYTDMAIEVLEPEGGQCAELLEVRRAAERAANLTRQLLAFSRRQVLELTLLDLNDVIENIMKMLRRIIGENIELVVAPESRLALVNADRSQIEQVLLNLCVNARDAMPEGGRLTIETDNVSFDEEYCDTHDWAKPGQYVLLSVTDSGCGMSEETQRQVFDPFFTTKEPGKGTGLGLATVYGVVRQHDGMIQVYSEVDKGTRFRIYLPASADNRVPVSISESEPVRGGAETILLAEDEEQVRTLAQRILEQAGYQVLVANDGEDAVRLYEDHANGIHLLLLDIVMPKKGGRAVFDHIAASNPNVKCLFVSGYSEDAVHTNFVLESGLHLLQKPYDRNNLLRAVRRVLDGTE